MELKSLHSKAVLLSQGGIVECNGHWLRAIVIPENYNACLYCEVNAVCNMEMCDLCSECDGYSRKKHILKFVHQTKL